MTGPEPGPGPAVVLPARIPVFPLPGALLLPRGRLPLTVFEPRYLAMTEDALGAGRLIGMVQPEEAIQGNRVPEEARLYRTGCLGRICSFNEAGPRYHIVLSGVSRFEVTATELTPKGYLMAEVDWSRYAGDLREEKRSTIDRRSLIQQLKPYFRQHELGADWKAVESVSEEELIATLSMACPLAPADKQALLEAPTLDERTVLLLALVEMALRTAGGGGGGAAVYH